VGKRRGRRAKRGALREAIHKVLSGGRVIRPADIVNALPGVGFRTASDPRVFYNTVYLSLKKDPAIKKTGEGFQLKKS